MKIVPGEKPELLNKNQLVNGECYCYDGLIYIKVTGDYAGVVNLENGVFTMQSNIAIDNRFAKINAEITVK